MSAPWDHPLAELRGARRHRFMEAADFTAANRWTFDSFARSIALNVFDPPIFIGFEMDSATPGAIICATVIPISSDKVMPPPAATGVRLRKWIDSTLAGLQNAAGSPYSLVAFASLARNASKTSDDDAGQPRVREGVRVELLSVDKRVFAVHPLLTSGRRKLSYAALNFVASA